MKHDKVYDEKGRYLPLRTCVACRTIRPKSEMIRVLNVNSTISVDDGTIKTGRGAYICKNEACIKKAMKIKGLERGLKAYVGEDIYKECMKYGNE